MTICKLAQVINVGCLSLIDYVNLPDAKPYQRLRTAVKEVLGLKSSAPEVVMSVLQPGTLDPVMRWIMAGLRLWYHILKTRPPKHDIDEIIESGKARLGKIAIEAFRWGISILETGLQVGGAFVPAREEWFIVRKALVSHLKKQQALRLARRRPALFEGLEAWNAKQHAKFLHLLNPLDARVLMKLWSGAIMCKHKRGQVYGESTECGCGWPDQTVKHLLWDCPLVAPPPLHLEYRRHLPPFQSVAHLLPLHADRHDVTLWRESCKRAIKVLSGKEQGRESHQDVLQLNGHVLCASADGEYVFCGKCFIARRARDKKWICLKPCAREEAEHRTLGEEWEYLGHSVCLTMDRWKICAQRPCFACAKCRQRVWATKGYREECPGEV